PSDIASDNDASPSRSPKIDKRIPISIPYTTPASEFLYGTSVVEAALRSKREPRRKLYKLYIYTGENRASAEQDVAIEKLARKNKVEVVRVAGDWLRLMDKMSNSRPHNGYILEASPLPRLPVTHLGEFNEENASEFEVALDHQSREEAAINGMDEVIKLSPDRFGRKPFVLFLDSILDPGNLGGMIRTAAFIGVTAVAISKNCASFSPAVLKASAGASEDIPLFTVNKPAGFIANSKLAGWKIFAAVAPSGDRPKPMFIEKLDSPLIEDPCILMLGNEGEGLRENLRSKADVHITIRGSGRNLNVDSLNVSVATGILCNAFLKVSNAKRLFEGEQSSKAEGDLF
ncbi:Alpha/beta knot methyltransferase, partial [Bisporella sp. PMI_857]